MYSNAVSYIFDGIVVDAYSSASCTPKVYPVSSSCNGKPSYRDRSRHYTNRVARTLRSIDHRRSLAVQGDIVKSLVYFNILIADTAHQKRIPRLQRFQSFPDSLSRAASQLPGRGLSQDGKKQDKSREKKQTDDVFWPAILNAPFSFVLINYCSLLKRNGWTFWLKRNKLSGSYLFFSNVSRS